jgi:hypothetical protein
MCSQVERQEIMRLEAEDLEGRRARQLGIGRVQRDAESCDIEKIRVGKTKASLEDCWLKANY